MRHCSLQIALACALAAALIAPGSAAADACFGSGSTAKADTATGPIKVVPGRSIGPIAVGMTKRRIRRAVGKKGLELFPFGVRGVPVDVRYGRWGFARTISASSARLVVNGVPLSAGPDDVEAALPGVERVDCGGGYTELYLTVGERRTSVFLPPAPGIPKVVVVNRAVTR